MRIVPDFGYGLRGRWRRLRRRPADWELCGLLWRHVGVCVPFVPGAYLRLPLAHPLDLWLAWRPQWGARRCPDGCLTRCIGTEGPIHDMTYEDGGWRLHDVVVERWFSPCGHRFRSMFEEGQSQ